MISVWIFMRLVQRVENDISISSQWIPRESNKEADSLSRMNDCDDWGIQTWVFMLLDKEWGYSLKKNIDI